MIIAITGTPGTGKTEVAKALAKRMGWQSVSLNELAAEEDLYKGFDKERMVRIVDLEKLKNEVNVLAVSHKNMIIESHYAHEMPSDVVIVLHTQPDVLRKRMVTKGFHTEKIAENMEAEMMNVIKDEATSLHKNVYEIDTTKRSPEKVAEDIESFIRGQHFITRDLRIPDDLLVEFRKPFGRVFKGSWDEAAKKVVKSVKGKKGIVVLVGDPTSHYLIKNGMKPDMIITDGKEKRKDFGKKIPFRGQSVDVKNPKRHITLELWKAIEKSVGVLRKKKIRINVKGEEDLAVLPCAIHLPVNSYIVYGLFGQGLVLVEVDRKKKEQAKALLENIMLMQ